jgi:hypothetical protein
MNDEVWRCYIKIRKFYCTMQYFIPVFETTSEFWFFKFTNIEQILSSFFTNMEHFSQANYAPGSAMDNSTPPKKEQRNSEETKGKSEETAMAR